LKGDSHGSTDTMPAQVSNGSIGVRGPRKTLTSAIVGDLAGRAVGHGVGGLVAQSRHGVMVEAGAWLRADAQGRRLLSGRHRRIGTEGQKRHSSSSGQASDVVSYIKKIIAGLHPIDAGWRTQVVVEHAPGRAPNVIALLRAEGQGAGATARASRRISGRRATSKMQLHRQSARHLLARRLVATWQSRSACWLALEQSSDARKAGQLKRRRVERSYRSPATSRSPAS
jgi:hypothetical protein